MNVLCGKELLASRLKKINYLAESDNVFTQESITFEVLCNSNNIVIKINNTDNENVEVGIMTHDGRVVLSNHVDASSKVEFDNVCNGIYLVYVKIDGKVNVKKIIV